MTSASPQSNLEQNKRLLIRWFEEVWNQGRTETIKELFAAECVMHDGMNTIHGPAGFMEFHDRLRGDFSGFVIKPIQALAEGDLACLHWSAEFRHTVRGKAVGITGTSLVRIKDGKFVEAWQNWDADGLTRQLV
jgi:predicted SnoaL-like aldol condensation-catalyzing enzyme